MMNGFTRPDRVIKILLGINAVASAAAAVVLAVTPPAIPNLVAIPLAPSQNFIAYLLSASELAFTGLCVSALRAKSVETVAQALFVLMIFHTASGLGGIWAVFEGAGVDILWNALLRGIMTAAIFYGYSRVKRG
jgi:hypothetical protein